MVSFRWQHDLSNVWPWGGTVSVRNQSAWRPAYRWKGDDGCEGWVATLHGFFFYGGPTAHSPIFCPLHPNPRQVARIPNVSRLTTYRKHIPQSHMVFEMPFNVIFNRRKVADNLKFGRAAWKCQKFEKASVWGQTVQNIYTLNHFWDVTLRQTTDKNDRPRTVSKVHEVVFDACPEKLDVRVSVCKIPSLLRLLGKKLQMRLN